MVKQYTDGYFEKGVWYTGSYEIELPMSNNCYEQMMDELDGRINSIASFNGNRSYLPSSDDREVEFIHPEPSYKGLWMIGVLLLVLAILIIMFIINM